MKFALLLASLISLPGALSAAVPDVEVKLQQLKDIGILPEEKLALRPEERLDPKRPNPFAERAKAKETKAVESVETEEIKIRKVFDSLKVTGITKAGDKYSALLGDLILEEGAQIPPIIPEQTQILRVTSITDKQVRIAWVEGAGFETVVPRQIIKRVELNPRVGVLLAAQPPGTTSEGAMAWLDENGKVVWPKKMVPGIDDLLDESAIAGTPSAQGYAEADTAPSDAAPNPSGPDSNLESPPGSAPVDSAIGAPLIDPDSGLEDPVQPAPEVETSPPDDAPPSGS